jgi:hypothetical protein
VNLPNFTRRRRKLEAVTFTPVRKVFKPQVKVRAKLDLSGWADRDRRVRWTIPTGRIGCIDADKAREFQVKGYVDILDGTVKPVSEDEAIEFLREVTTIQVGG